MLEALPALDYHLIKAATDVAAAHPFFRTLVYFGAEWLVLVFPAALFWIWRQGNTKGSQHAPQKAVVLAVASVIIGIAVNTVIGYVYLRARPFVTHPDLLAMGFKVDAQSFPSSHTMFSFAIASSIYLSGYKRLGGWLLAAAAVVGLSRIFAGVHYPGDVLGGLAVGCLCSLYLHRESSALKRYLP